VQSCCVSLVVVSSLCVSFGCGPGQYSILGFQLKGLGFSKTILVSSSWWKVRFMDGMFDAYRPGVCFNPLIL
jgi:hypothetical protein